MLEESVKERAREFFNQAYQHQMKGELDQAVALYKESIELFPTAEAHTFLGWTYSFQGRLDMAIDECRKAIDVDPDFGNPYNDIGAYLIEQQKHDEAISWLERALRAPRYESYHFPWFNLGRVYVVKDQYTRACECFDKALEIEPGYEAARAAKAAVRRSIH